VLVWCTDVVISVCSIGRVEQIYCVRQSFSTLGVEGITDYVKPSGNYMYHQFNIQQFYVLPTQCIYVFCVDLRTNSDYFPIQH
jgi:hypothetical protein